MMLVTVLGVAGVAGGSLAIALRTGSTVEEKWGAQLSTTRGLSVRANAIAADATGTIFAAGEYEGVLSVSSTSSSTARTLSAAGRVGGYVVAAAASDGAIKWMLNVEATDADADGASTNDVVAYNEKLYIAGSFDSTAASASVLDSSGRAFGSPSRLERVAESGFSGVFVLAIDLSRMTPVVEWTSTTSVLANTIERRPKLATDGSTVFLAVSERGASAAAARDTRVLRLEADGARETARLVVRGAELRDLTFSKGRTASGGLLVLVLDTIDDTLEVNSTNLVSNASTQTTLVAGIPTSPTSLVLALDASFEPAWMMSAPAEGLQINGVASDEKGGVYFVGTHLPTTEPTTLQQYLPPMASEVQLSASSSTEVLPALASKSDVFVGHLSGGGVFDPNFFPNQTPIGGDGSDTGHSIDCRDGRVLVGGAIEGAATFARASTPAGDAVQAAVISVGATTGYPEWASVVASERDNSFPFDVAVMPQSASLGALEGVLSGSFTDRFDYRTIAMQAVGAQDAFVLPASSPA